MARGEGVRLYADGALGPEQRQILHARVVADDHYRFHSVVEPAQAIDKMPRLGEVNTVFKAYDDGIAKHLAERIECLNRPPRRRTEDEIGPVFF